MYKLLQNQNIREKFIFGIVNKLTDWQWLVDYINENYEFLKISDWEKYTNYQIPEPISLFSMLLKNTKIEKPKFTKSDIRQMYFLAKFNNGIIEWKEAKTKISNEFLKLILFANCVTQQINKDNNTNFYFYWNIFINPNLFQIYDFDTLRTNQQELLDYLKTIKIQNIDLLKKVFMFNLNRTKVKYNHKLLFNLKDDILSENAFSFQHKPAPKYIPWQENELMNMLDTKYNGKKLLPFIGSWNGNDYPNIGSWTKSKLDNMRNYFNNNIIANFVIESIYYFKNRKNSNQGKINRKYLPSRETLLLHVHLLVKAIKDKEKNKQIIHSSSMKLISCLFLDSATKQLKKRRRF